MQELEDRIRHDGIVKAGNVLKVDAFLNHQCDVELFDHMGAEWARLFEGVEINKILTIEASGIGMACIAAQHFGGVPVVFAKKAQSINLDGEQYATTIYSFTKQKEYPVIVGKRFLSEGDKVQLVGFGTFEVKERAARTGRNPRTKEEIEIPASKLPVFKAGKALKDAVQ